MRRTDTADSAGDGEWGEWGEWGELPVIARQTTGWPSPAEDHVEQALDLTEFLITHPAATFFMEADSDAMVEAGVHTRDVLVVDRSLKPVAGCVVVAAVEGELVVRYYQPISGGVLLLADNPSYPPLRVQGEQELIVWGVVTHVIHSFK